MHVVKLPHVREAGLEHLGECQRGQGLEFVGVDSLDEPIHELAPGPEAVLARAPALRQARQAALERMTVHVAEAGHPDRMALVALVRLDTAVNTVYAAFGGDDPHPLSPAVRQQCRLKPQARHANRASRCPLRCASSYNGRIRSSRQ